MSSVWFDYTEPVCATEHYKSKYQGTSLHEFDVVRFLLTSLGDTALQKLVTGHKLA